MRMRNLLSAMLIVALFASLLIPAAAVGAQEVTDTYTRWNGVRDKVGFQVGAFFVNHSTFARLQPRGLPEIPGVDLESDISMPNNTTDFRLDGYLRLGKRHRIRAGWWQMNRNVVNQLRASINWEGEVYEVGATIAAKWNTQVVKADYRYSIFKGERYDIGAALGFFIMDVDAGLGFAADAADVVTDTKRTAPLPMIGLDIEYEIAPRWVVKGFGQYFGISIDDTIDGSWWEARAAVEWIPLKNFGLGAGYNFARVDLDIQLSEGLVSQFQYNYKINGPHLYAVASF